MTPVKKLILVLLVLALAACTGPVPLPPSESPRASLPAGPWYNVYFTDPANGRSLRGGPDAKLADAITDARLTVDVAVLQLDLWSIRDALINAQKRGLEVRVVMESEYLDAPEVQDLQEAGIRVLGDRREGLMHNKFVVIDRQEVWTGSVNFTVSDTYKNNNNLIRIRSQQLAEDYTTEFNEMFEDDKFGPGSPANTPHPSLTINGTRIDVCFSPDDGCAARLAAVLKQAEHSIDFLAFSFTSDDLADIVLQRAKRNVAVRGVMEASQVGSNAGGEFQRLQQAGLDVLKDGNPRNMHDKVFIVDGKIVVTGSYNFTYNGETKNDENMLIIYNSDIAALYLAEFDRIYADAK